MAALPVDDLSSAGASQMATLLRAELGIMRRSCRPSRSWAAASAPIQPIPTAAVGDRAAVSGTVSIRKRPWPGACGGAIRR